MRLVVGSNSALKIAAVKTALRQAGRRAQVEGTDAESGVPVQPIEGETQIGARTRARFAQLTQHGSWSVGIENGLFRKRKRWLDKAVIVLRAPNGNEWMQESAAIRFPDDIVQEARRRGCETTTAGAILAEQTGCDPQDPHACLTEGRTTRHHLLVTALTRLFREAFQKESR